MNVGHSLCITFVVLCLRGSYNVIFFGELSFFSWKIDIFAWELLKYTYPYYFYVVVLRLCDYDNRMSDGAAAVSSHQI